MTKKANYRKSWFVGTLKKNDVRFFKDINMLHMHKKFYEEIESGGSYSS